MAQIPKGPQLPIPTKASNRTYPSFVSTITNASFDQVLPQIKLAFRNAYDYIFQIQDQLENSLNLLNDNTVHAGVVEDLFENLVLYPAADYTLGSRYMVTGFRNTNLTGSVEYFTKLVKQAPTWTLLSGIIYGNQNQIPNNFTINEAGVIFGVLDYGHQLVWNGTAWNFSPGDPGSKYFVDTPGTRPNGPVGAWALCDGTAVNILQNDGTLALFTTPNCTTVGGEKTIVEVGSAYTGTPVAAQVPTWQAGAKTDDESAHTHPVPPESFSITIGGGNIESGSSGLIFSVASPGTYTGSSAGTTTGPGSPHSHPLSNTNARLNAPSEANGGLGRRIVFTRYVRR